jgi:hypothetical protein
MTPDYDELPTAQSTLRARYVTPLVWCKGGCQHRLKPICMDSWHPGARRCH